MPTERRNRFYRGDTPTLEEAMSCAAIAWSVCASIHREFAKGKDPFFRIRQEDYAEHEREAREAYTKMFNVPDGSTKNAD